MFAHTHRLLCSAASRSAAPSISSLIGNLKTSKVFNINLARTILQNPQVNGEQVDDVVTRARGAGAQTSELYEDYFGFCARTKDGTRINRMLRDVVADGFPQSRRGPWEKLVICQYFDAGNLRAGVEMAGKVSNVGERDKIMANILDQYCRASVRGVEMSERVVEEMKRMDMNPGLPVYKVLALGFARFEEVEKSRGMMQKMRRERVYPDVEVYNHVITAAGNKEELYTCLQFLDEMLREGVKPDRQTFNRMIHVFAKKGSTDKCFKMLERMQEEGITPDEHTFTAFWQVVTKESNTHELACLMDMLVEVTAENSAGKVAGNSAGNLAGNEQKKVAKVGVPSEVQKLGDAMRRAGVTPGMNAFYRLIQALKHRGEVGLCTKLLDTMEKLGMPPNLNFYNTAIAAVGRTQHLDKLHELLDTIRRADLQPDQHTYTALARTYSRVGDAKRCREALAEIRALKVPLKRENLFSLIESFASLGETEVCAELLKEAKRSEDRGEREVFQTTFHAMFAAYARKGETGKCAELLREMRNRGVRPTLATYTQVVRAFASKLEKEACEGVLREMAQDGLTPDKAIQVMVGEMNKHIEEREKGIGGEHKTNQNEESEGVEGERTKPVESAWIDVLMTYEKEKKESVALP